MNRIYYKLTQEEAEDLCKKLNVKLPITRKELGMKDREFIDNIHKYRIWLNKAESIAITPCHYYDGITHQFSHEVIGSTTNSHISQFIRKTNMPVRIFTY